jgi:spore coat polysaccharide biosynthesis protein SpsF
MSNIVAIIQARMGSERFYGKVMMDLIGSPMLCHVHDRVARSRLVDDIVVAIPTTPENDCLKNLCEQHRWNCFRGSEYDVLDRFYHASNAFHADTIVRITSDCPLIDPGLIDRVIAEFMHSAPVPDYLSNCIPQRTYPRGLDTEVIRFAALEKSWREDYNRALREHVTQYILQNPYKFSIAGSMDTENNSALRWTVDTREDYELVKSIYQYFGNNTFSWRDALELVRQNPRLSAVNAHIKQKEIPRGKQAILMAH